jgi:molybdopterin converting factor small subunit
MTRVLDVQCFGPARELAGGEVIRVEVALPATVAEVVAALGVGNAALADLLPCCAIAVGDEIVARDYVLRAGDEVAVLPPVSGG